ncbi:hypothetical protein BKA63DRAFT_497422 [Paraphoma chrysanthemicola]|nr:hypothetical protein BKA63DRAFT_497422 [Paraphoma chrysanthemicola]
MRPAVGTLRGDGQSRQSFRLLRKAREAAVFRFSTAVVLLWWEDLVESYCDRVAHAGYDSYQSDDIGIILAIVNLEVLSLDPAGWNAKWLQTGKPGPVVGGFPSYSNTSVLLTSMTQDSKA